METYYEGCEERMEIFCHELKYKSTLARIKYIENLARIKMKLSVIKGV